MSIGRGPSCRSSPACPAETIKNIEHGIFRPQEDTTERLIRTFASHGVEFTEGEGVRLRKDSVVRYEGVDGFKRFMDDVYEAAKAPEAREHGTKKICVSNVDDKLFVKYLGDYASVHARRMNEIKDVRVRVIVQEKDLFSAPDSKYIEYRENPHQSVSNVPFYVYGDKFAVLGFAEDKAPQIVVIGSELVAEAYRDQFEVLWQNSKPRNRGKQC